MKPHNLTREQLEDLACDKTGLDMPDVMHLSDKELEHLAGLSEPTATPAPRKPRTPAPAKPARPIMLGAELIDHNGALHRRIEYSDRSVAIVRTGERVLFEGRTVSAALVLHYLRTGERVTRMPRSVKTHQAAIRHNGRVIHLGRFATAAEALAARDAARMRIAIGLDPREST